MATSRSSVAVVLDAMVSTHPCRSDSTTGLQNARNAAGLPKDHHTEQQKIHSWLDNAHGRPAELVAAGLEALDFVNLGVAIVDSARRLLSANRTAEQILASRDGLEVTVDGVLATFKRSSNPSLGTVIQQLCKDELNGKRSNKDAVLIVQRPSGKRPLTLLLRPLQSRRPRERTTPTILVFILDADLPLPTTESALRELYGFTFREARLAYLLMSGNTLEDCCRSLQIRISTGRMHLANLFVKTGVQRQGQLVALLLKSLGMVCDSEMVHQGAVPSAEPTQPVVQPSRQSVTGSEIATAELEALDLLNVGIAVINHLCKLLFANQTAQRILATGEGLCVTPDGVLNTLTQSCNPSLATFVQQTLQRKARGRSTVDTVLAVRRHSGKRPLVLLVRALCGWAQSHPTAPAILIFVLDPELPVATDESGLRQLFGFTSTEARLARLLMEGNGLEECCGQLEIRVPTGRKHLGNLFAKTGVQRQGQLISLLLKSVGMLRFQCGERVPKLLIAHDSHSAFSGHEAQHGR